MATKTQISSPLDREAKIDAYADNLTSEILERAKANLREQFHFFHPTSDSCDEKEFDGLLEKRLGKFFGMRRVFSEYAGDFVENRTESEDWIAECSDKKRAVSEPAQEFAENRADIATPIPSADSETVTKKGGKSIFKVILRAWKERFGKSKEVTKDETSDKEPVEEMDDSEKAEDVKKAPSPPHASTSSTPPLSTMDEDLQPDEHPLAESPKEEVRSLKSTDSSESKKEEESSSSSRTSERSSPVTEAAKLLVSQVVDASVHTLQTSESASTLDGVKSGKKPARKSFYKRVKRAWKKRFGKKKSRRRVLVKKAKKDNIETEADGQLRESPEILGEEEVIRSISTSPRSSADSLESKSPRQPKRSTSSTPPNDMDEDSQPEERPLAVSPKEEVRSLKSTDSNEPKEEEASTSDKRSSSSQTSERSSPVTEAAKLLVPQTVNASVQTLRTFESVRRSKKPARKSFYKRAKLAWKKHFGKRRNRARVVVFNTEEEDKEIEADRQVRESPEVLVEEEVIRPPSTTLRSSADSPVTQVAKVPVSDAIDDSIQTLQPPEAVRVENITEFSKQMVEHFRACHADPLVAVEPEGEVSTDGQTHSIQVSAKTPSPPGKVLRIKVSPLNEECNNTEVGGQPNESPVRNTEADGETNESPVRSETSVKEEYVFKTPSPKRPSEGFKGNKQPKVPGDQKLVLEHEKICGIIGRFFQGLSEVQWREISEGVYNQDVKEALVDMCADVLKFIADAVIIIVVQSIRCGSSPPKGLSAHLLEHFNNIIQTSFENSFSLALAEIIGADANNLRISPELTQAIAGGVIQEVNSVLFTGTRDRRSKGRFTNNAAQKKTLRGATATMRSFLTGRVTAIKAKVLKKSEADKKAQMIARDPNVQGWARSRGGDQTLQSVDMSAGAGSVSADSTALKTEEQQHPSIPDHLFTKTGPQEDPKSDLLASQDMKDIADMRIQKSTESLIQDPDTFVASGSKNSKSLAEATADVSSNITSEDKDEGITYSVRVCDSHNCQKKKKCYWFVRLVLFCLCCSHYDCCDC